MGGLAKDKPSLSAIRQGRPKPQNPVHMPVAKVVAEIGCNHKGEIAIAEQMIETAFSFCRVDAVKFQKRCVRELLTPTEYTAPHPVAKNSYGKTYGEHRENLEFNLDAHRRLQQKCAQIGVEYTCSVWDLASAREIASLQPAHIKVPSATNLNFPVLEYLRNEYAGEVHISLGMTTMEEREEIANFFAAGNRLHEVVFYACTSGYPVAFDELCLLEIPALCTKYAGRVKGVGFSGHHLGIAMDIAAVTLGAQWVERHFTLDRTWRGTDHAASLEPDGLRRLCRDVHSLDAALAHKPQEMLAVEKAQREKLKKKISLHKH